MNFVIIRIIYSAVCALTSILLFRSYKKSGNKNLRDFSIIFLLLGLYLIVLISYVLVDDLKIIALSYDIAVAIYFIMVAVGLKVALSFLEISFRTSLISIGSLLLVGVGVVTYQVIFPSIPEITDIPGLVLWNVGIPTLLITGLAGLIVGNIWAYVFYLNFVNSKIKMSKIKSFLIMISSSALGFSSLTYFYQSELTFYASFVFGLIGVVGFLSVAVLRLKK